MEEATFSKAVALRRDIERYQRMLRSVSDERLVSQLEALLDEARQKLAEVERGASR